MATMDYILTVQSTTSGTATLTSSPFEIKQYHSRYNDPEMPTVSESCQIRLKDGSVANNLDEMRTLRKLMRQAKDAQADPNLGRVYVTFAEASGGTAYRSELKEILGPWDVSALDYPHWTGDTQFATLSWERANWWEGPEAQLAITNPNGTANTSGLRVYNCNDGSVIDTTYYRHNYFDVTGTAVVGELLAPTRLEMTNLFTETASYRLQHIWIGQNWTNPSTFTHHYEASFGTASADSDASAGTYHHASFSSGTEQDIDSWAITSAQIAAAAGRHFKFVTRHWTDPRLANTRFRIRLMSDSIAVWDSGLVGLDSNWALVVQDMVTFKLPPWLAGLSSLGSLTLVLRIYQNTGVWQSWDMDFLTLLPIDGFRRIVGVNGQGAVLNIRIVDDGIERYLYEDNGSGTDKRGYYAGYGMPIHLYPGKDQRLYFLMHSSQGSRAEIARKISVKLHYRPRRLSL